MPVPQRPLKDFDTFPVNDSVVADRLDQLEAVYSLKIQEHRLLIEQAKRDRNEADIKPLNAHAPDFTIGIRRAA